MKSTTKRNAVMAAAVALAFGAGAIAQQALADQPYMHQALGQLMSARATLAAGADDKGGHRVAAMRDIDAAIGEVRAGIGFARGY